MRLGCACFLVWAGLAGCANPRPELELIIPSRAGSEVDVAVSVQGQNLIPSSAVDPTTGARTASTDGFHLRMGKGSVWGELGNVAWTDTQHLTATLPREVARGLPIGELDVELVDPRGETVSKTNAFEELGPDVDAPVIVFLAPAANTPVLPRMLLQGSIVATDSGTKVETLSWSYYERGVFRVGKTCPAADQPCAFSVNVSAALSPGDTVEVVAEAVDSSARQNPGRASLTFIVVPHPTADEAVPSEGGTAGGTDVVIQGSAMVPGRTRALVEGQPLFPNGGIVSDDGLSLSGHMPAHAAGSVKIMLVTEGVESGGRAIFEYLQTPQIISVQPNSGSAAGGTAVVITGLGFRPSTVVFFGASLQTALPLRDQLVQVDAGKIVGHTPPGRDVTTVWAFDDELGASPLPDAFTWRAP